MTNLKSILFYVVGLVGLILASMLITERMEVEVSELPVPTVANDPASPTPAAVYNRSNCSNTARSFTYSDIPKPPLTAMQQTSLASNLQGDPLRFTGTVYASDRRTPLPDVLMTVWQADAEGNYQRADSLSLSAQFRTDAEGRYEFTTIKPGNYRVGCQHLPAHIHFRLSYLDHDPVFMSLYFEGDPYLEEVGSVEPAFVRSLRTRTGPDGPILQATFDITLHVNPN